MLEIVDNEWRQDELPFDQISVPADKLPDPEADSAESHLTLKEQVRDFMILLFLIYLRYEYDKQILTLPYFLTGAKMD